LSTIKNADEILVMKSGEVKERGTHSELLAMNGVYKKLISKQLYADGDASANATTETSIK
jgi:subfamily B ATP-binding cassette protein MsbA